MDTDNNINEDLLRKFGVISGKEEYFFSKTEISEIASRPTTFIFDILRYIYSDEGPVGRVYKKYGIRYRDTDFLKIIGNELYVNKEKEIKSLLPAYSYLVNNNLSPKFSKFSYIIPTIKNLFFLNKINTSEYDNLFNKLKEKIEEKRVKRGINRDFKKFISDYEMIFEINLLSTVALKRFSTALKNESIGILEIINGQSSFVDMKKYSIKPPKGLRGNSLDISDESSFIFNNDNNEKKNKSLDNWWRKLPTYKKKFLENKIIEVIIYDRLRELGRSLSVKNISIIRDLLLERAKRNNFKDNRSIYFSSLKSALNNKIDEKECINNKREYNKFKDISSPKDISSLKVNQKSDVIGVSSGSVVGILRNKKFLDKQEDITSIKRETILYTDNLSPNLVIYLNGISGIVSTNGSLLSHLAILAREKNIPVVVGVNLKEGGIKIGDRISINGSTGDIKKI